MKLVKNILPLIIASFFAVVLFSCQKGGEPVPFIDADGTEKVCDKDSSANQRGDQSGDSGSNGTYGNSGGDNGGGTSGGDDNVIGGDDNEDDDDVVEDFDLGGDPKNDDDDSAGNGDI